MRYFFHIGYNGSKYKGWQRHPNGINVQQVIERYLEKILKTKVSIIGCGRTDAGVHASQFFFHVDVEQPWEFDMLFRLNKILPPDIAVFDILPMEDSAHARFDAIERSYDYYIHTYKDPFLSETSSLYLIQNLKTEAMKAAASMLLHYTDYKSFCVTPDEHNTTLCYITEAQWFSDKAGDRFCFHISANRFLSRMIRIIVGKLLLIGTGTLSLDEFESYLATEKKPRHLDPAYPQGLYLSKVSYPYLNLQPRNSFNFNLQNQSEAGWQSL
jgi:tRNA pseudouridine38-40 synthase